ncbi:hypothetical protein AURDEDRAFT_125240 [Auricularia subglabra TFB-10046 SS5]|nr:hypothetical protein AURDEDRAFT_125240 [Auricularia subglabra TFB-10046 SS5]
MCMYSLPTSEKIRLAEVCSSWKAMVRSPALWSTITEIEKPADLVVILPRSGHLPLDITIRLSSNQDLSLIDNALRLHARRVRTLRLNFQSSPGGFTGLPSAFGYAAPILEELQLHWIPRRGIIYDPDAAIIPSALFDQQAPKLRSIVLLGFGLPAACHALVSVSSVSISGGCTGIERLFDLMPSLRRLELAHLGRALALPDVPRRSRRLLTEVCIRNVTPYLDSLDKLGYLVAPRISIFDDLDVALVADAAPWVDTSRWTESILSINGTGAAELVLRGNDERVAHFSGRNPSLVHCANVRTLLSEYNFTDIRHLVLPLDLHLDSVAQSELPECPLIRDTLYLPHLQTLTLRFGAQGQGEYSLVDPHVRRGVIKAPLLARIVVDSERRDPTAVPTIRAARLALFITSTLEVDDPRALMLHIDTAAGVLLHGGSGGAAEIESLRACVGTLSAQDLDGYIAGVASEWLAGSVSCTDVAALLDAFNRVFARSLANIGARWNSTHDRLCVLPPELRDVCMFSLPIADKGRLAMVCSSWQDMSSSPALWSTVLSSDKPVDLAPVLPRSGHLPLDVTLSLSSKQDLRLADAALCSHAARLRTLRITFDDTRGTQMSSFTGLTSELGYAAPLLAELQLRWIPWRGIIYDTDVSIIPSTLFREHAPSLRAVVLDDFGLPTACPALASVTSASLSGPCPGVEGLFDLMPSLRKLELARLGRDARLPVVPHPCRALLEEVSIRGVDPDLDNLDLLGYTGVHRISLSNNRELSLIANAASWVDTALWPESTLSLNAACVAELMLCGHEGRKARFSAKDTYPDPWNIRWMLAAYNYIDIQHLVLPLHLAVDTSRLPDCPLIHDIFYLPSLRQLTLRFGAHSPGAYSMMDLHIKRGVIKAPLLTRIVVDREHGQLTATTTSEIRAAHLALFITSAIQVDDCRSLHLVIDSASGVRLHGKSGGDAEIEGLRDCVGTLVF